MSDMSPQTLEEIRNIQMLIGRNVLAFQNVEHLLKIIHNFRQGAGTVDSLKNRKVEIDKLSIGRLSDVSDKGNLFKINSESSKKRDAKPYLSYKTQLNDDALDSAIKFFNDINVDRNWLVHNFTTKWTLDKAENRAEARNWLLSQYDATMTQREVLLSSVNIIAELTNAWSEHLNSNEVIEALDECISEAKSTGKSQDLSFTISLVAQEDDLVAK